MTFLAVFFFAQKFLPLIHLLCVLFHSLGSFTLQKGFHITKAPQLLGCLTRGCLNSSDENLLDELTNDGEEVSSSTESRIAIDFFKHSWCCFAVADVSFFKDGFIELWSINQGANETGSSNQHACCCSSNSTGHIVCILSSTFLLFMMRRLSSTSTSTHTLYMHHTKVRQFALHQSQGKSA